MQLIVNKWTALYLTRALRAKSGLPRVRCELANPECAPRSRWTWGLLQSYVPVPDAEKTYVCVGEEGLRLRTKNVCCTIYGQGIPGDAFVPLDDGLVMSGPDAYCSLGEH